MEYEYTIAELEAMAQEDESWEPDPQMRAMFIAQLHGFIIGT